MSECRKQWERERIDLSAWDLRRSLDTCRDARDFLADDAVVCDDVLALYGPLE